ncbi:hypothetical protein SAMD00019534_064410 [Acytostelium subglobosum LB1]|uniref:hypothetical protein n=1 Tax=Acytostelium subglobosum LB1 TaxID=1410327 RepID=UPI000644B2D4|nr:hypothetical protein SAMD00019534_064410 [Acytostelium subglobosum LB1]GAM23266.1 hypothetical protein SAMD00019534_064410 [Acytostelium subglobosum LB1]|eukprot:XP_012753715.1 hypothetical protein SAMD00019534_064410 [Acytostelium subglobosum LB1]
MSLRSSLISYRHHIIHGRQHQQQPQQQQQQQQQQHSGNNIMQLGDSIYCASMSSDKGSSSSSSNNNNNNNNINNSGGGKKHVQHGNNNYNQNANDTASEEEVTATIYQKLNFLKTSELSDSTTLHQLRFEDFSNQLPDIEQSLEKELDDNADDENDDDQDGMVGLEHDEEYKRMNIFQRLWTKFKTKTRSSYNTSTASHVDLENPMVWSDKPLINADEQTLKKSDRMFNRYTLRLHPYRLEQEYLQVHFAKQMMLLRMTNLIGILAVSYGIFKVSVFMLLAVRIFCFNVFAFSLFLSFLSNKRYYMHTYHPLFLFNFTTLFLSILLEYHNATITFIIFLYSVVFSCLYSLGCLLFVWMVLLNLVHAVLFIFFLLMQSSLDTPNLISFILYVLTIFLVGATHLYILEKSRKESFVDSKRLQRKTERLKVEKEKTEQLLANILPEFVIKMINEHSTTRTIRAGRANTISSREEAASTVTTSKQISEPPPPIAKHFPNCSILYCDIVEFTTLASRVEAEQLVRLLNEVFTEFDRVVELHHCEKIKTDGDSYVCAGGLTIENTQHFKAIVEVASDILRLPILTSNCLNVQIKLRVGAATGSVIGGVIGCEKFQFDVWGEAIAIAHTLEQNGTPGKIHLCEKHLEKLPVDANYGTIEENSDCRLDFKTVLLSPHPVDDAKLQESTDPANNTTALGVPNATSLKQSGSAGGGSGAAGAGSVKPRTKSKAKSDLWNKNDSMVHILMVPFKHGNSIFFKDTEKSRSRGLFSEDMSGVDRCFKEYTNFNRVAVKFRNPRVESAYQRYVLDKTVVETKLFLLMGMMLHAEFFFDDYIMQSRPILNATNIYIGVGLFFAIFMMLSFTRLFKIGIVYQLSFFFMTMLFGVGTILELMRYGNPLARSSMIRVTMTFLYANVFHAMSFFAESVANLTLIIVFFLCSTFVSTSLPEHIFLTDYIGIVLIPLIQLCSSYGMKLLLRKAWVIKSNVKFKGLIIQKEREKSSKLLENILPTSISEKLLAREGRGRGNGNGMLIAQNYSHVAIMFINITGFEKLPTMGASVMVSYMNYIFSILDAQLSKFGMEKIKTIGTTYMLASGLQTSGQLPLQHPKMFLANAANMALTVKEYVMRLDEHLNVQVGISFGPCVAGCIGLKRAKFDVWGDTANTASRMQTSAPPGKIQVTKEVSRILRKGFVLEERGVIRVKGKGDMTTFYLVEKREPVQTPSPSSLTIDTSISISSDSLQQQSQQLIQVSSESVQQPQVVRTQADMLLDVRCQVCDYEPATVMPIDNGISEVDSHKHSVDCLDKEVVAVEDNVDAAADMVTGADIELVK